MSESTAASPACPACGASQEPASAPARGGILGGVPTPEEIAYSTLPHAERVALRAANERGPRTCPACGEKLFNTGGELLPHRIASIFLPMHVAAARLRNHLRRLAITRVGPIEGDCYFLPFYKCEGTSPFEDPSFALLAANLGDDRLEHPHLPPADMKPFEAPAEGAAGPSGEAAAPVRLLEPSRTPAEAAARSAPGGYGVARAVELIHYPFYLMRVEDLGRIEAVWLDGIEAKLIHHRLRLPPPMPATKTRAVACLIPAAVAALAGALAPFPAGVALGAAVWAAGAPWLRASLLGSWRG